MKVIAILEVMWDWRAQTSSAGYREQAPRHFRINPDNYSGRRLYKLIGGAEGNKMLVTNACRELVSSARDRGTPDPKWLAENLAFLDGEEHGPVDLVLVCGRVAQETYRRCGYRPRQARVIQIPHPAARAVWTKAYIEATTKMIQAAVE